MYNEPFKRNLWTLSTHINKIFFFCGKKNLLEILCKWMVDENEYKSATTRTSVFSLYHFTLYTIKVYYRSNSAIIISTWWHLFLAKNAQHSHIFSNNIVFEFGQKVYTLHCNFADVTIWFLWPRLLMAKTCFWETPLSLLHSSIDFWSFR